MIYFSTAEVDDIDSVASFRMILLNNGKSHYGSANNDELLKIKNHFKSWMKKNLKKDDVHIVISKNDDEEIISMGIGIIDNRAPVQGSLNGKSGWISSLIVHPSYRKQGLGKETLNTLIKWFDMNYVSKIILHSTKEGEFLYNKLGFLKDNENIFIKTIY